MQPLCTQGSSAYPFASEGCSAQGGGKVFTVQGQEACFWEGGAGLPSRWPGASHLAGPRPDAPLSARSFPGVGGITTSEERGQSAHSGAELFASPACHLPPAGLLRTVSIPSLPLSGRAAFCKKLRISVPHFPHLIN